MTIVMHVGYGVLLLIALVLVVAMLLKHGLPCFWRTQVDDDESEAEEIDVKETLIKIEESPVVVKKPRRRKRSPEPVIEVIEPSTPPYVSEERDEYMIIKEDLDLPSVDIEAEYIMPPKIKRERPK